MNRKFNIKDRPGVIAVASIRNHFERMIQGTPGLRFTPLGTVEKDGQFSHYSDTETDLFWRGFALGMRVAERVTQTKTP